MLPSSSQNLSSSLYLYLPLYIYIFLSISITLCFTFYDFLILAVLFLSFFLLMFINLNLSLSLCPCVFIFTAFMHWQSFNLFMATYVNIDTVCDHLYNVFHCLVNDFHYFAASKKNIHKILGQKLFFGPIS